MVACCLSLCFWISSLSFPAAADVSLSPNLPTDIPISLSKENSLLNKGEFSTVQRLFDEFSWQSFIAFNWPLNKKGQPLSSLSNSGIPRWLSLHESLQVYRPDGSPPQSDPPRMCKNNPGNLRELYLTSTVADNTKDLDLADEVNQAFTTPLYDQNGKEVRYEIFLNDVEYDYIVDNQLYNIEGQIAYSKKTHKPVNFPMGSYPQKRLGATELKLAWKELGSDDIQSRFYTETILLPKLASNGEPILDKKGNFTDCRRQNMGLVGMHISTKTESSPQWIWATFEHIDNLNVNDLVKVGGKPLHALFHDYSSVGQTMPVNVPPIARNSEGKPDPINGIKKTQVSRPIPIPGAAKQLSAEYQKQLKAIKSPLQYYQLIDAQWPTAPYPSNPSYPAVPGSPFSDNLPEGITRKSTGAPAPIYLTNSTMETYFQAGNQTAQIQENGFPPDSTPVFGTESCMGCHFSAGIATDFIIKTDNGTKPQKVPIYAGDLSADFSWLLQQKAQWVDSSVPNS